MFQPEYTMGDRFQCYTAFVGINSMNGAAGRDPTIRRGRWLEYFTVGWNLLEAAVGIGAGLFAGSIALVGFGIDSLIETSSGAILLWRLREGEEGEEREKKALNLVGFSFLALAGYVAFEAIKSLLVRESPDKSLVGIILAALSLAVMPLLAVAKRRVAFKLSSRAMQADSRQTDICAYLPAILFNGGTPVLIPTHLDGDFELDPAAVEAAITPRTKAIFLGYPCNPTGAVLPEAKTRAIAEIAVRHDLLVVSDEIYDRLVYGDHVHHAFSSFEGARERTILLGGFSKAYAMTGWRVGWAAAPQHILEGILKVHQYGIMSAPTTAQDAALAALTGAEMDVRRMVAEYDRRRRMFVDGLNRIGLPTFEPRGAFYAFPRITSTGMTSAAFSERLLFEQQVAVVPGDAFGPSGEGHVRACYATSYEGLEEALVRIERFLGSL